MHGPLDLPPISSQAVPSGEAAAHAIMCLLSTLGCPPPPSLPLLPWLPATWSQLSLHSKPTPLSFPGSPAAVLPLRQYQCCRFSGTAACMGYWCHELSVKHPPLVWLNRLAVASHRPQTASGNLLCMCMYTHLKAVCGFAASLAAPIGSLPDALSGGHVCTCAI